MEDKTKALLNTSGALDALQQNMSQVISKLPSVSDHDIKDLEDKVLTKTCKVISDNFSSEEIDLLLTFLSSKIGRKFANIWKSVLIEMSMVTSDVCHEWFRDQAKLAVLKNPEFANYIIKDSAMILESDGGKIICNTKTKELHMSATSPEHKISFEYIEKCLPDNWKCSFKLKEKK